MKCTIHMHGKNPGPPAEAHRSQLFRHLAQGVRRIGPGSTRCWINIPARADPVAPDASLADDFRDIIHERHTESIFDQYYAIFNHYHDSKTLNVHNSRGRQVNPMVAATITKWRERR